MKCPRCGLINAPTAQHCDCGYGLSDGSFLQPPAGSYGPGERLQRIGCLVAVVAFAAVVVVNGSSQGRQSSFWLLVRVMGDVFMLVAAGGFAAWVVGSLRRRRGK